MYRRRLRVASSALQSAVLEADEMDGGSPPIPNANCEPVQFALTVPTVSDRIAQTVVQRYLEPILEPVFHEDSYQPVVQAAEFRVRQILVLPGRKGRKGRGLGRCWIL